MDGCRSRVFTRSWDSALPRPRVEDIGGGVSGGIGGITRRPPPPLTILTIVKGLRT